MVELGAFEMDGAGPGVSPRCSSVQAIPSSTKFTKPSSPAAKPHLTTPCSTPWAPSWLSPSCGFGSVFALRISPPEHTAGGPHAIHSLACRSRSGHRSLLLPARHSRAHLDHWRSLLGASG